MRLLQIGKYYYPFLGGTEQVTRDIAEAVSCEQKVFCFNSGRKTVVDKVGGVEVVRIGSCLKVASQSISSGYYGQLRKVFSEFKPDLVILHYPNPFAVHYLLKILKRYPNVKLVVYWHLDIVKQKFLRLFFRGQNKRLLERADKIIAATPNHISGSDSISKYKEKCKVLPYTVKVPLNRTVSERATKIREENKDCIVCFAIGRHVPYKGMEYLVKASKFLPENYKIFIAGDGPLTKSLKKMAAGDGKVVFLGKISEEDKTAYYQACDIFCFPSITKNEAFGIAMGEAMAYGKPVVCFHIEGSGVNYVALKDVTGLEVENGNPEKFAEAIMYLGKNPDIAEKFGKAGVERIETCFTFEKFKENINSLIKEYNA